MVKRMGQESKEYWLKLFLMGIATAFITLGLRYYKLEWKSIIYFIFYALFSGLSVFIKLKEKR